MAKGRLSKATQALICDWSAVTVSPAFTASITPHATLCAYGLRRMWYRKQFIIRWREIHEFCLAANCGAQTGILDVW